ncbi:hypothetical protein ABB37_08516 [Leptomonas pyrrhocoris]|uniref:Uncharacterized protein n=1 Tax=Leptomonas pyrrhocoris TaxID=157538 RepID=A0A0M9FSP4_LEPPY|nr:hypothetical protein ABB37_08516 [Leptomonas pyrrhocoris]KPA75197.1 hypothetical protein ABB37_08516 [Leptomonas pyrrhocoris]|eukprot:XP_015653636.1 hypothetical protein ABB37_08516 [Leptomonas pyrrhocoris]
MSAAPSRNWASMLKEKKTAVVVPKTAVAVPTEVPTPAAVAAPAVTAAAAVEPAMKEEAAPTQSIEEHAQSPASVPTPVEVAAPAVAYTSFGPVSVPESLAKLVQPSEFHFAGAVAPRAPVVAAPQPVAVQPAPATSPAQIAAAAAVTSSSEIREHTQRAAPQPVYNPPVNYFVPQHNTARPYGGELGSVPRYFNAERHFNVEQQHSAQPYHPTYQASYGNYRGGYNGASFSPYDNVYSHYYQSQGAPYMSGRLQAQPPYYPQRNYPQEQQQQQ